MEDFLKGICVTVLKSLLCSDNNFGTYWNKVSQTDLSPNEIFTNSDSRAYCLNILKSGEEWEYFLLILDVYEIMEILYI